MKKCVLNLDLENDKDEQRRALKTISTLPGIDEITVDLKGKKLTVIGTVDPVSVVSKLRKRNWPAHIISVGVWPEKKEEPKKEAAPKKEEEPKKEEAKKEEPKEAEGAKEEAKKEEPKKKEAGKKGEEPKKEVEKKVEPEMVLGTAAALAYRPAQQFRQYYPPPPPMNTYYHVHHSIEENPNACVIC